MNAHQPIEVQLVDALLADDTELAKQLAAQLHARGIDATAIDAALQAHPQLQEPLLAVLQAVIPLSRRAAKRRAIRAAEERDWADWEEGRRS